MNTLTEKQNLRYELLKANNYDAKNSKACYDFVMEADETSENKKAGKLADGIYLVSDKGMELYTGQAADKKAIYMGVGVKLGNKSLLVAMGDVTEDEITLTEKQGGTRFITSYHEAVADWNGKKNTDDIRGILNDDILLADDEYIPSLGEMYFILLHIYEINKALKAIGGKPLSGWYWSSTQYCAARAWILYLSNGDAIGNSKATNQTRVRAVSAFLPLNS